MRHDLAQFSVRGSLIFHWNAAMRSCKGLCHAVTARTWALILFQNKPSIQSTWSVLPHNIMWYKQWKRAVLQHRLTDGEKPKWAAPTGEVRAVPLRNVRASLLTLRPCAQMIKLLRPSAVATPHEREWYKRQPRWSIHL